MGNTNKGGGKTKLKPHHSRDTREARLENLFTMHNAVKCRDTGGSLGTRSRSLAFRGTLPCIENSLTQLLAPELAPCELARVSLVTTETYPGQDLIRVPN